MFSRLTGLFLSTTILVTGFSPALADDVEAWRLFVGDQSAAKLTVLDGAKGEPVAEFPLKGWLLFTSPRPRDRG